ncbi:PaaI family thioesterase [Streptomyces sp. MST-110588]|nr:PaaI family thioesterase [Streptomyces sp. MST-110588]
MQGACCMMLGDVATWIAMMAQVEQWERAVTLEMKTNFLGAARCDLWCEGWVVKAGRRSVFCQAATRDAEGRQVAHHTVTYLLP